MLLKKSKNGLRVCTGTGMWTTMTRKLKETYTSLMKTSNLIKVLHFPSLLNFRRANLSLHSLILSHLTIPTGLFLLNSVIII